MRRRVLAIILGIGMIVAMLTGLPSDAEAATDSSIVRVKLSIGTVTSFSFYVDGNYTVGDTVLERQPYTAKVESSEVSLYCGSTLVASGSTVTIAQHAATADRNNFVYLNNYYYGYRRYLGDLCFSVSGGNLLLVNNIDLEQYLYGVVPYEMSDSWYIEALKAQAVAARNYTVKRMGSSGSYDIADTSSTDQVYKGYDPSTTNAIAAVDATAGQVLMSGSTVIDAYYSASNGGWTELPYHRWGGGADWTYYQITYDPYDIANPYSRYETITLPVAIDSDHPVTTSTNMSGTIDADKALVLIRQAIYASGQLSSYGVSSANGFTLTGVLDLSTNTYDTSNGQDHSRTQDLDGDGNPDPNLCADKVMATGNFTVSVDGTPVTVTDITFDMRNLCSSEGGTAFFYASLGMYVVEPIYDGETITAFALSMRRYGHGCGLSQRGAQQRAKSVAEGGGGQTYDEILSFYYPGTTLTTLTLTRPTLTEITPAPDYSNATIVSDDPLNVRSGPSTSYNILGILLDGARVEVTDDYYSSTWHQISYAGGTAYVYASYVVLDSPFVSKHVTGVTLDVSTTVIAPGETQTLTETVLPDVAANKAVTWSSDNTAVATVSNGVVMAVTEGTANITVTTAEGGFTATCGVTVKSNGITSTQYTITSTLIKDVVKNTDIAQLFANLDNDPANLHVYRTDGTEVTEGVVGTGMQVVLMTGGVETDRLTVLIKGDVDGDGNVTVADYTLVRYEILDLKSLNGAYLAAGDVDNDGSVTVADYTLIRYDILGLKSIF